MLDKVLNILYLSLFLITPFIMAPYTSELFEFNKMIFIYLIASGVLFVWLLKIILHKRIIIKKTPLDFPILLFLATQILSALFSIDRHTSFFGYYGRFNGGLLSIFSYLVLFYGFIENFAENRARAGQFITGILKVSLIASLFVILWGLSGKLGFDFSCLLFTGQLSNSCWTDQFKPAERMFSTLGQPNWLGAYLAINFFIAFYFFLKNLTNQKFNKTYLTTIFYLILNFAAVLFTRSRSSLLAIIAGILL